MCGAAVKDGRVRWQQERTTGITEKNTYITQPRPFPLRRTFGITMHVYVIYFYY